MRFLMLVLLALGCTASASAKGLDQANAGLAAAQRGDYDESIRLYFSALAAGDMSPFNVMLAHHNLGNTYQSKGDYGRAIAEYDTAINLQPDFAEAWFARGRAYFALAQFAAAVSDFSQSVKLAPTDGYSVLWLHLARSRSDVSDAGEFSRNAARLDDASWPAPLLDLFLGKTTLQQVRVASAAGDAAARNERRCEAAFYIGEYQLLAKKTADAIPLLREAGQVCSYLSDERGAAVVELKRNLLVAPR